MTKHVNEQFLSLYDCIQLIAHKSCNKKDIGKMYLTGAEEDHAEKMAIGTLVEILKQGKVIATGLKAEKKRKPYTEKWQSQQYSGLSKERTVIDPVAWNEVKIHRPNYQLGEMWVRFPNAQYESVFLPTEQFEDCFDCKINFGKDNKNNPEQNQHMRNYVPPYMLVMFNAIEHFKITNENQPLVETLIEWFRAQKIDGQKISENEAKKLASFVRLPASKKGGNKPWSKSNIKGD